MASQSANYKTQAALILLAILLGAVLGLGAFQPLRAWLDSRHPQPEPSPIGLQTVTEVLDLLQEDYIRSLDTRELLEGALTGMRAFLEKKGIQEGTAGASPDPGPRPVTGRVHPALPGSPGGSRHRDPGIELRCLTGLVEAINDPYTTVMDPEQYRRLSEQMSGGNSAEWASTWRPTCAMRRLTVIEPIEKVPPPPPASDRGLITHIDGEDTSEFDIEAATLKIRGEVGTRVVLTLKRGTLPLRRDLQRQQIHAPAPRPRCFPTRSATCGSDSSVRTQDGSSRPTGRVAPTGSPPWSWMSATTGRLYQRCPDVVSTRGQGQRGGQCGESPSERNESHRADAQKKVQLPVVLLMNRFSASASEITAGL